MTTRWWIVTTTNIMQSSPINLGAVEVAEGEAAVVGVAMEEAADITREKSVPTTTIMIIIVAITVAAVVVREVVVVVGTAAEVLSRRRRRTEAIRGSRLCLPVRSQASASWAPQPTWPLATMTAPWRSCPTRWNRWVAPSGRPSAPSPEV